MRSCSTQNIGSHDSVAQEGPLRLYPLTESRPPRITPVRPERCADIIGTLQEIGTARRRHGRLRPSARMRGGRTRSAEQGVLILCNPLTGNWSSSSTIRTRRSPSCTPTTSAISTPRGCPTTSRADSAARSSRPVGPCSTSRTSSTTATCCPASSTTTSGEAEASITISWRSCRLTPLARGALCLHRARREHPFSPEERPSWR